MGLQKLGNRRVAIVKGVRTPFVKAGTFFGELTALDLGRIVVGELVQRSEIDPDEIDSCLFGQVIPTLTATSIAREVVIAAGLPRKIECHTVVRACATSLQAITDAALHIALGQSEIVIAGGTESMSDPPIYTSRSLAHALLASSRAKNIREKIKPFQKLSPKDLIPVPPAIAEYSTGQTMGDSAEKMAKENGITRREQDEISLASHHNAARAWKEGFFNGHVFHVNVPPRFDKVADHDNIVREDTSLDALSQLKPVFDRRYGSVTAGNSSPLTDGAAAVLMMSEERAKALKLEPLGFIRQFAYAATDPAEQLLQGPAIAAPLALDRAGMKLADFDRIEMHEAFAAQIASNLQAFASADYAKKLGRAAPMGEVDRGKLNLNGGSIALGHPFAATGARLVTQALEELKRAKKNTVLCTVCAAGGLGAALVLERN